MLRVHAFGHGTFPWRYMTGKDITWALVSGEDTEEQMDKFYDPWRRVPSGYDSQFAMENPL